MKETGSVLARQMQFYERTAEKYDSWHVDAHDEHFVALDLIAALIPALGVESVLDLGCGTGRALSYLRERLPGLRLRGADPSKELLKIAVERNGIPSEWLDLADGYSLPYLDGEFDAVVATGVLHHVESPDVVVSEMMRVARRAVFISDLNTYGMGRLPYRLMKLLARTVGLGSYLNWLRNGGHVWFYSEGDGVAFPYSVFDSSKQLRHGFTQVVSVATAGGTRRLEAPILFATHALLVASDPA